MVDIEMKYVVVAEAFIQVSWFAFKAAGYHMCIAVIEDKEQPMAVHTDDLAQTEVIRKFTSFAEVSANEEVLNEMLNVTADLVSESFHHEE